MPFINDSSLVLLFILTGVLVTGFLLMRYGRSNALRDTGGPSQLPVMDFQGYVQTGNRLYQDYRYKEALEHYLQAIKLNNKDPMVHYRIGRIYQAMEDLAHAESAFQNVLTITPDSVEALYELSRIYQKQSKPDMALKYVDQLLHFSPGHEEGTKLRVRVLLDKNDFQTASTMLEDLLKLEPENAELIVLLGKTYQKNQQWEQALEIYTSLLAKDLKDRKNLKFEIYKIYLKQSRYDEAIEILQDILDTGSGTISRDELKAELAKCWCHKAREAFRVGEYPKAVDYYNQALNHNPNYADIYVGLGKIHAEQDDREMALTYYKKAMELGQNNAQALMDVATLYEQLDQFDLAIDCMKQAEALLPTARVYYYLGTLYGQKGDLENCVTYLTHATAKDPQYVDAFYNLGVALEQQRKFKEATNMYKQVLTLDKNHVEAKTNLKYLQNKAK